MRTKGVNKEQQLKYILECRNSGLTDYQWCQEHGIHPGTFYNWVSKLVFILMISRILRVNSVVLNQSNKVMVLLTIFAFYGSMK